LPEHIYYGIPRGGSFVAGIMETLGYRTTDQPANATAFVDDILDSGATKTKWLRRFPDTPFFALFERSDKWLVFPWEGEMETDAADVVRRTLQLIGEDPAREGLRETPERVVRSWRELYSGYQQTPAAVLKCDFEADGYDEMIVCRNVQFYSTCEHHMQPFFGRAHVGYLPDKRVVGLSKLARLVDVFARRLQIQERLTEQIADALQNHIQPRGVAVVIEAQHFCMICRGVRKEQSSMITSSLKGCLRDPAARTEFFTLIHRPN
jgi:GTP cyclohydrolase I